MSHGQNALSAFGKLLSIENAQTCDIAFLVGEEKEEICAHQAILLARSDVFNAMFSKRWLLDESFLSLRNSRIVQIQIPDIKPSIFRIFLRFVYTDFLKNDLTTEEASELLYVSHKYLVAPLTEILERFLVKNVNEKNAISLCTVANIFNLYRLKIEAQKFVALNFSTLMEDSSFVEIEEVTLFNVLHTHQVIIDELALFKALERWASARLDDGLEDWDDIDPAEVLGLKKRRILKNIIPLIRFQLISYKDFVNEVVPTQMLSHDEIEMIVKFYRRGVRPTGHRLSSEPKRLQYSIIPQSYTVNCRICSKYLAPRR